MEYLHSQQRYVVYDHGDWHWGRSNCILIIQMAEWWETGMLACSCAHWKSSCFV